MGQERETVHWSRVLRVVLFKLAVPWAAKAKPRVGISETRRARVVIIPKSNGCERSLVPIAIFNLIPGLPIPGADFIDTEFGNVTLCCLRNERAPRSDLRAVVKRGEHRCTIRVLGRTHELKAWLEAVCHKTLHKNIHLGEVVGASGGLIGDCYEVEEEVDANLPPILATVRDSADVNKILVHVLAKAVVRQSWCRGVAVASMSPRSVDGRWDRDGATALRAVRWGCYVRVSGERVATRSALHAEYNSPVAAAVPEVRERAERRGGGVDGYVECGRRAAYRRENRRQSDGANHSRSRAHCRADEIANGQWP